MKRHLLTVNIFIICLAILGSNNWAVTPYQAQIFKARDEVMPALIHIQPVIYDYLTGREKKLAIVGSGVIISDDGYAITNFHVAGRAERIICTLEDREQVPAKLIGSDAATDLAVIKLDLSDYNKPLKPARLGHFKDLQVGQTVLALGSPLALSRSVSMGVISTLNRYFPGDIRLPSGEKTGRYNTWLQTDAAINPGNSGGPLVNLNGEVVGINTRGVFFAENIGFSIPIDIVRNVTDKLIKFGKVERAWIGVHAQALQDLESFFGAKTNNGVLIASVDPGSPAETAGVQAGDLISEFNGKPVSARFEEELPAFYQLIASAPIGEPIELKLISRGQKETINVTPRLVGDLQGEDYDFESWGFTAKSITHQMTIDNRLDDTLGIYVTQARSTGPAYQGGLRRGDIIKSINRETVDDLQSLIERYEAIAEGNDILLSVKRRSSIRLVLIKPNLNAENVTPQNQEPIENE